MMRRILTVLAIPVGLCLASGAAQAQEIQLTGPLAGAPAVRHLRLYRQGRFEFAPQASFTILDEYQRNIMIGFQANYNLTDWFAIGLWAAPPKPLAIHTPAGLTEKIQDVTQARRAVDVGEPNSPTDETVGISTNNRLTARSIGNDFQKQLGTMEWVVAPQVTMVPFRGKLSIFQKVFVDADAYIFAGPAFVGLSERENCDRTNCSVRFSTKSRTAVTATFGLGLKFYMSKLLSLGVEWRALPFAWNTGGFDIRGGGPDKKLPDWNIDENDRDFKFNQLVGVSLGLHLPASVKVSE